jgi:hypothetical protein
VGYFSRKQKSNAAVKKKSDFLAIHKGKETRRTLLVEREREPRVIGVEKGKVLPFSHKTV